MQLIDIISVVIQSIIALFLIWYAIETYKLRKQTAYQCKVSIQPVLDFIYDDKSEAFVKTLENVGFGPALNLHVYTWRAQTSQYLSLPEHHRPSIIKVNAIIQTKPLEVIDSSKIKENHPRLATMIDDMAKTGDLVNSLAIYDDSVGNTYFSLQHGVYYSSVNPLTFGPL